MAAGVLKAALIQLPEALAPAARAADEAGVLHHAKMFSDRLTRDARARREFADGDGSSPAKANHQLQADPVAQCGEERHGAEQLRADNWIRLPAQDISRRAK